MAATILQFPAPASAPAAPPLPGDEEQFIARLRADPIPGLAHLGDGALCVVFRKLAAALEGAESHAGASR
ncbi:hypothetical protein [Luteimonas changyuni]|uniref:hypothetical protein n=1 Tax=Luteimonas sp. MJ145 TaxID=3129234 RepID=UPI0031BADF0A